jgi:phosphatidate cytidylyltransferase
LIQRLIAAAIGLAILLPAVILGGELAVEVIVPLAALVCLYEYGAMAFPGDRISQVAVGLGWAALYGTTLYAPPEVLPVAVGGVTLGAMMFTTFRPLELESAADRLGRLLLGVLWIGLLATLVLIRRHEHGLAWVFLVLASSWLGDTGGYFAGKYLGRRPLYPLVSPKKTWEGVFGGITLATVGAFCVRAVGLPELSVIDCLVLGPMLCGLGVVGDLSESLLKRAFQVKDSGTIMPGHGGLLDRIDSVMFVAPALYAWLIVVEG